MKKRTSQRSRRSTSRPAAAVAPEDTLLKGALANILFQNVPAELATHHLPQFARAECKAGEQIFDEYSKGRDLYLIVSGRVRIKKYTKFGVESLLAVLHPGDFFGELSVVDGLPRSARAEAMDDCSLLVLTPETFRALLAESQDFRLNLLNNLGIRLRTMDQTFVLELGRSALAAKTKMDHLARIVEASKIVNSTLDIDTLLDTILRVATQSTAADRGTLYLVDEQANELWSKVAQGKNMVEIRLPLGKGLAGYVAKTGETMNIADAYKDPRFNPEIDRKSGYRTKNVLCMPMRDKEGKIVGVFQLLNKRDGPFGREDEAFIEALSVHAAIAVENARLAREMVHTERLSAVGRMASTIIHDIKNPMATLRMYAQVIKRKTGDSESSQLADEIIRQVDRFVSMTQEILDFSRGVSRSPSRARRAVGRHGKSSGVHREGPREARHCHRTRVRIHRTGPPRPGQGVARILQSCWQRGRRDGQGRDADHPHKATGCICGLRIRRHRRRHPRGDPPPGLRAVLHVGQAARDRTWPCDRQEDCGRP